MGVAGEIEFDGPSKLAPQDVAARVDAAKEKAATAVIQEQQTQAKAAAARKEAVRLKVPDVPQGAARKQATVTPKSPTLAGKQAKPPTQQAAPSTSPPSSSSAPQSQPPEARGSMDEDEPSQDFAHSQRQDSVEEEEQGGPASNTRNKRQKTGQQAGSSQQSGRADF